MEMYTIGDVVEALENAERIGTEKDIPEGSRYVKMSDTLILKLIDTLESVADVHELL